MDLQNLYLSFKKQEFFFVLHSIIAVPKKELHENIHFGFWKFCEIFQFDDVINDCWANLFALSCLWRTHGSLFLSLSGRARPESAGTNKGPVTELQEFCIFYFTKLVQVCICWWFFKYVLFYCLKKLPFNVFWHWEY